MIRFHVLILSVVIWGGCESTLNRQVVHYEQVRDHESAIRLLEQEVQSKPQNAEAHYYLGRLYLQELRHVDGRMALEKAMLLSNRYDQQAQYELDNRLSETLHAGVKALQERELDEAVRQFTFATEVAPTSNMAFKGLGNALSERGDLDEAEAAYRNVVQIDTDDLEVWLNLSELSLRKQAYAQAISDAREVLTREPDQKAAMRRMAYAALLGGEYALADSTFERYMTLPGGDDVLQDYAFMSFNAGRYEVAEPYLLKVLEKGDPEGDVRFMLGEAYFAMDEYEKMAGIYENVLEQFPDNVYAIQGLLIAHERMGNVAETIRLKNRLKTLSGLTSKK